MPTFVTMTGPGAATVTDDTAVAVTTALTPAVVAGFSSLITVIGNPNVPGTVLASLAQINDNVARIADQSKGLSKAVSDLNVAIGTMSVAVANNNAIQATLAANQISTNNFQTQVTKDALKRADIPEPEMPSVKDQLTEAVKQGVEFASLSRINGAVTEFINSTIADTAKWIAGTEAYRTVEGYLKQVKDAILSIEVPSIKSIASIIKTGSTPSG